DRSGGAVLLRHDFDHRRNARVERLARKLTDHLAERVNYHHRRPGAHAVGIPHGEIVVVDDRMLDLVAPDDLADVLRFALALELGRVHADHNQLFGIFRFQPLEVGDDVNTVDAAIRPEVQHHDLAAQIFHADRRAGVN